jgi:sugar lactone lactonase YvrE
MFLPLLLLSIWTRSGANIVLPCEIAIYDVQGKTVAGGSEGKALNQLDTPKALFIDPNDDLYITDYSNNRVVKWKKDALSGIVVASGQELTQEEQLSCVLHGCKGKLHLPISVTVDKQGIMFIINRYTVGFGGDQVLRWLEGSKTGERLPIFAIRDLTDVTFDADENLYVADEYSSDISKYSKDGTFNKIVAGGNDKGQALNQLSSRKLNYYMFLAFASVSFCLAKGVAFDKNGAVFVSDFRNHRVVKWAKNANTGTVVAGGNGRGNGLNQLDGPIGIAVDQAENIYVVDSNNHRVLQISGGTSRIIAGGNGKGKAANQLNHPHGLAFDNLGNLYVVDTNNSRVQKFYIQFELCSGEFVQALTAQEQQS